MGNSRINSREFVKLATLAASAGVTSAAAPLISRAGEVSRPNAPRASYYMNAQSNYWQ
jgi:hypothetical protein